MIDYLHPNRRQSISWRVAIRAGSAALALAAVAGSGVTIVVYEAALSSTYELADAQAQQITEATTENVRLGGDYGDLPYQLLRSDGLVVSSSAALASSPAVVPFPTLGEDALVGVRLSGLPSLHLNAEGKVAGAVTETFSAPRTESGDIPGGAVEDGGDVNYRVAVLVTTTGAREAATNAAPFTVSVAAALALVVAAVAAISTRQALGPVEAMRKAAEGRTPAGGLPVPATGDELQALAQTLNDMLARIRQADLARSRFIGDAAHELRSPVTSIMTALEVARSHPGSMTPDEVWDHLWLEGSRLRDLAEDLLTSVASPALRGQTRVANVVRQSIDAVAPLLESQDLRVTTSLSVSDEVMVGLTELQLRRVLDNLFSNAARHALARVAVNVSLRGETVCLQVENDGDPIEVSDYDRVFEPFVRLDAARSRLDGGTGLGLAIVRELVTTAGGTVTVRAEPYTTFAVHLPRQSDPL